MEIWFKVLEKSWKSPGIPPNTRKSIPDMTLSFTPHWGLGLFLSFFNPYFLSLKAEHEIYGVFF